MPSSRRLSPSKSLQKLRTAFSHSPTRRAEPTAPLSPLSTTTSASSTSAGSPTSTQEAFTGFAGFTFGSPISSPVSHAPEVFSQPDSRRVIRRKKSCVEIEQEQERFQFDRALVGLVEPRPRVGPALGGIEEVLCGEV